MENRFEKVRKILIVILLLNLFVAISKIAYGIISNTLSMQADGYHSLFDGVSNIIGIIGIQIASRPPDKNHPYGHRKYETMASIAIAMLLLFVGVEILHSSIDRFMTGAQPQITSMSFIVMVTTIMINLFVTIYEHRKGVQLNSEILIADSMHTRSDIYVSLSVILGLIAIEMGYPIIDPFIALIIAIVIVRAGILIIRQSSYTLCDVSRIDDKAICCIVAAMEGVEECHNIRTRGGADDIHIDLHVKVNPEMHTYKAHALAHDVEKRLKVSFVGVSDVVVHIEPAKNT
ncbi:MAG: cation diffusion facilitator family transporter [Methanosarcinaceae archaeon]|nr:cation diffusion facilitator family transporter [Methanosarcinaceae archaeon]